MSASTAYKPAHGGYPGVATATPQAKIVSLETLAQAELEKGLSNAETALGYIVRLSESDFGSVNQRRGFDLIVDDALASVRKLQRIQVALLVALDNGGEVVYS